MGRTLKSSALAALDDVYHSMADASRADPVPPLELRLDRLRRLRAAIAENEVRFDRAISADFGHRASIETTHPRRVYG